MREGVGRADRLFRGKDGRELRLEYSARVLQDGRTHASLRDVTQRRRSRGPAADEPRAPARDRRDAAGDRRARARLRRGHVGDRRAGAAPLPGRRRGRPLVRGLRLRRHPGGRDRGRHGSATASTVRRACQASPPCTGEAVSVPDTELDTRVNVESCRRTGRALGDLRTALPRRHRRSAPCRSSPRARTRSTSSRSRRPA